VCCGATKEAMKEAAVATNWCIRISSDQLQIEGCGPPNALRLVALDEEGKRVASTVNAQESLNLVQGGR
jgi:hypothetical protein